MNVKVSDLTRVLKDIPYAVVRQDRSNIDALDVFIKVDGEELSATVSNSWTVREYREVHSMRPNGVIYDCGVDGVECVIKYPNGYGAHIISTPTIPGGTSAIEMGIKCGRHLVYTTPVAEDLLLNLELSDIPEILRHVENLAQDGLTYVDGFKPDEKYNKNLVIREVFAWAVRQK